MKKTIMMVFLLCTIVFAQQKGTFTDPRDKKTYKTVKIGEQTWMAQNLDYHGEDGFFGLCYGDEPKKKRKPKLNCKNYGRLYDWKEAMEACPAGWHLPSNKEWQILVDFAGGDKVAGKKLKSKSGWAKYDFSGKNPMFKKCKFEIIDDRGRVTGIEDYCATDEYGFSAFPGYVKGITGNWWSATENGDDADRAYGWGTSYQHIDLRRAPYFKSPILLLSVRCLQD
ncbi:MAG: hypothetical protein LBU89_12000 [Fibromonadaceae bacterium]|jgi:uncharacterized protein (TIGR02145 family)|nr:hypothetical protein [Fibromonadaceae bacterium]